MLRLSIVATIAVLSSAVPLKRMQKRPNFITIVADDLGYFDSGLAGNTNVSTPNLDRLVGGGVRLERHYAYKYCSPSRRSLVTGRWPVHLDEMNQVQDGIDLRMATLGDKLSGVGYQTALIGKTHWGIATTDHLPYNRGWDSHLGYLGGGESYWSGHECVGGDSAGPNCDTFTAQLDMWHDDHPAEKEYIGVYSSDLFSQQAVELIDDHDFGEKPLWLHLNYQAVHNPQTSPPGEDHHDNAGSLVFYEVLRRMDAGIANVTAALERRGAWDDTLVLFMSDNGAASLGNSHLSLPVGPLVGCMHVAITTTRTAHTLIWPTAPSPGNNHPLRGGKYSPWEGGVRTQSALFGGLLPSSSAGSTFKGLVHVADWYPTLCNLAGVDPSDSPPSSASNSEWFWPVDGVDVWPFITQGAADPHGPIVLSSLITSGPGGGALVHGKYKIVLDAEDNSWDQPPDGKSSAPSLSGLSNQSCVPGSGKAPKCKVCSAQRPCLYNVEHDPSELHDLAKEKPQVLRALNRSFSKLVYERRMPVHLNFTEQGGWKCASNPKKSPWGVYIGPECWCTAKSGNCTYE